MEVSIFRKLFAGSKKLHYIALLQWSVHEHPLIQRGRFVFLLFGRTDWAAAPAFGMSRMTFEPLKSQQREDNPLNYAQYSF